MGRIIHYSKIYIIPHMPPPPGSVIYPSNRPPTSMTVDEKQEKLSLKQAEDKINNWFQDQKEAEREAMKALVYRILYNEGLRINRAEQVITKSFKV